ncbi:hypothetical protein ACLGI4_16615 [Streptomyces sp. HMX112]|uniref:hypothetical protein n=1 Tax=Streptomyces sp. HMX112 TaxID=3390850 RepID=UPI003A811D8D
MWTLVVVLVAAGLVLSGVETRLKGTHRRIARLEHKIDLILDHLGIQDTDPALAQVAELVRQGKKIEAIKRYRTLTGADLIEAKAAVDRLDAQP